MTHISRMAGSI